MDGGNNQITQPPKKFNLKMNEIQNIYNEKYFIIVAFCIIESCVLVKKQCEQMNK